MTGWIIYSREDLEKNQSFIEMFQERFKSYGINLETVVVEETESYVNYEPPSFAINRSRNAGIAKVLEQEGVRVFNSSRVTEIANNKGKNYEFLKDVVPFLPIKYKDNITISKISDNGFTYPYIIKSCKGHGGSQVFMVHNKQEKEQALQDMNGDNYIIQQCCSDLGRDVRVYIIGNKIVAAVLRTSENSFKSNFSLGGKVQQYQLNSKEINMVNAITQKLPMDYAGIDFTFHNGKAVFNEIEDAVGARMLYQVTDIDIVQKYTDYIVKEMKI